MGASAKDYQVVIGLEIHVQLKTSSKLFSDAANSFGERANSLVSVIDLGMPGVLPVVNEQAIVCAVRLGLALGADIHPASVFARKHYFYPDLPKGYQISQLEDPIVANGKLEIAGDDGQPRQIDIVRAHLEEDAGKLLHLPNRTSGVDFNRSGVPLLEVVTAPQLSSAAEAGRLMRALHHLVCYLEVGAGNLEQGNFRCDANVSLRPDATAPLGTRTELKNINSFRFVEKAIEHEIGRQRRCIEAGERIVQETRLYDADHDRTYAMRSKEDAQDYRYFPDPDLLPVIVDEAMVERVRAEMPPLPSQRIKAWRERFGLAEDDAWQLCADAAVADYLDAAIAADAESAKAAAQWIIQEILPRLAQDCQGDMRRCPLAAGDLAALLGKLRRQELTTPMARQLFELLWRQEGAIEELIDKHNLKPMSDESGLIEIIDALLVENPKQAEQLRGGKDKLIGFFVGQAMKRSGGKADPRRLQELVRARLAGDGS